VHVATWFFDAPFWEDANNPVFSKVPKRFAEPGGVVVISGNRDYFAEFPNKTSCWEHKFFRHEPADLKATLRLHKQGVDGALMVADHHKWAWGKSVRDNMCSRCFEAVNKAYI
jgi:hypothetical protein